MTAALPEAVLSIRTDADVVTVRQRVRERAIEIGFSLVDQTKVVTAASELARNALTHGGGGTLRMDTVEGMGRRGIRLLFEDNGPGIPDIALAMQPGFSTGTGLGLGLTGAKRLMDEFAIETQPGVGTRVTVLKWNR
jgi:serine/threonine-protein kinase RsbT